MIIKRNGQILYGESELIKRVNKAARKGVLNRSMLAYLRDIRKLVPKPIRIKVKEGRGGAHSFYLEETVKELERMMSEYVKEGNTLTDMKPRYDEKIQQLKDETEEFRKTIDLDFRISQGFEAAGMGPMLASLNLKGHPRVERISDMPLEKQLRYVLGVKSAGKSEEVVDRYMMEIVRSYCERKGLKVAEKGG